MADTGLQAIPYWEYVTISYLICAVVLFGLIALIHIDGVRQKKLLKELESQQKSTAPSNNSEVDLN